MSIGKRWFAWYPVKLYEVRHNADGHGYLEWIGNTWWHWVLRVKNLNHGNLHFELDELK